MVKFTFSMRRLLIRLASAPCISFSLTTFGWVRATRGKHNAEFTNDLTLSRLFTKFSDEVQEAPCTFKRPFPIVCVMFCLEDIRH